jgi:hypothetical protein
VQYDQKGHWSQTARHKVANDLEVRLRSLQEQTDPELPAQASQAFGVTN